MQPFLFEVPYDDRFRLWQTLQEFAGTITGFDLQTRDQFPQHIPVLKIKIPGPNMRVGQVDQNFHLD
jgi:hypothetical protein